MPACRTRSSHCATAPWAGVWPDFPAQATDQYIGTLGARIVLTDDLEVRAAMTGSWLRQMGFAGVYMLAEAGPEIGCPKLPILESDTHPEAAIDCPALAELLSRNAATV